MAELSTTYMGLPISGPVVVAACSLSGRLDNIRRAEAAGAGALVIKSLFEEQIMAEELKLEHDLETGSESYREAVTYFPPVEHAGAREHLMWVEKARAAASNMPLIASLNAVTPAGWTGYARQLAETGVDGLELNVYAVQTDLQRTAAEIETQLYQTVENVLTEVDCPVAVKLSPYYTSIPNVAGELDRRGVAALVLFNRFLQPDIDIEDQALRNAMDLSSPDQLRLALRYVALLHGKIAADLVAATGVHSGADAVKQLLVGAAAVQMASALYINEIEYISEVNRQITEWMDRKGYDTLADFRGRLSQEDVPDRFAFERAQYVELLLQQA